MNIVTEEKVNLLE